MGEHNLVARIQHVLNPDPRSGRILPMAVAMALLVVGTASLAWAAYTRPGWIAVPIVDMPEPEEEVVWPAAEAHPSAMYGRPGNQRSDASTHETGVTIRLVDEAGRAVAGARVGVRPKWRDIAPDFPPGTPAALVVSDQDGIYRIRSKRLLQPAGCDPVVPCFALHQDRQLAGTLNLTKGDWGKEFEVVMRPVSRVRFVLDSEEVRNAGRSVTWSKGFIKLPDNKLSSLLRDTQGAPYAFEYLLPPGDYLLVAFAGSDDMRETDLRFMGFRVPAGLPEVDLGVIQLRRAARAQPLRPAVN